MSIIVLVMLTAALAVCWAACARADTPPADLQATHTATLDRIKYKRYDALDWTYIEPDATGTGNCSVFAYTKRQDSRAAGYNAQFKSCVLTKRQWPRLHPSWRMGSRKPLPVDHSGQPGGLQIIFARRLNLNPPGSIYRTCSSHPYPLGTLLTSDTEGSTSPA